MKLQRIIVLCHSLFITIIYCQNDFDSFRKRLDDMEKNFQQRITQLEIKLDSYQEYCKMLPDNICGVCRCRDDDKLVEKYYCDCQNIQPKRDCMEFKQYGFKVNGVYKIHLNNLKTVQVFCDQDTDGGGWTIIQRRIDGSVGFSRDWNNYKNGFGQLQNEFWLGNENIFLLSHQGLYPRGNELRIELKNAQGIKKYAKYRQFQLGNSMTDYSLHIKDYAGTAVDALAYNNGGKFTTFDVDNDSWEKNCAGIYEGGWWFKECSRCKLNGLFFPGGKLTGTTGTGIHWEEGTPFTNFDYPLVFSEMKVRRMI